MSIPKEQIEQYIAELKQPGRVQRNGAFYLVYAHGRWYLMTPMYTAGPNARQYIQSVHFMDDEGVRRYLSNFTALPPTSTIDQMFAGFATEVAYKVLPCAKEYLPLLESDMLRASTGYTTDTISVSKIGARGEQFVQALQKAMDHEVIGFALEFTRPAPDKE